MTQSLRPLPTKTKGFAIPFLSNNTKQWEYARYEKKKSNKGGKEPSLLKKKPYISGNNTAYTL